MLNLIWVENAYDNFEYHIQCSSLYKSNNAISPNASSSNYNRFYLEKTYKLETHWGSRAMIRIERSPEIFSGHFTNSKIQNGSKRLFKMRVKIAMKSLLT